MWDKFCWIFCPVLPQLLCNSWWRHQMATFSALLALCTGTSPVTGEFPSQRPVTRSFDVLFDLRLNTLLSKQRWGWWFNTLRPRQNGRHFADDIFKYIFFNENVWIPIQISLKFVPKGPINNIPALVQTMAWRRPGDKPLSEPMMARLPTYICVTRPQWVKTPTHPLWRHCNVTSVFLCYSNTGIKFCTYFCST